MKIENIDVKPIYTTQVQMSNGRVFDIATYYCSNPECDCTIARFDFYENDEKAFMIMLDYAAWRVDSLKIYKSDDDYMKLINEFMEDTTNEYKENIRAAKLMRKDVMRTGFDYSNFEISNMVYYSKVYLSPDYVQLIVHENGQVYFVCDMYCPNPTCDCNDVLLTFQVVTDGKALDLPVLNIRLSFKTGKYEIEHNSQNMTDEQADRMLRHLTEIFGGFDMGIRVLKERYSRIKKWSAKYLFPKLYTSEPYEPSYTRTRKVGRNEPCPCGSGKKYKHCCGWRLKTT